MADERGNVSDLLQERLRRKARDLSARCPRCGQENFMRSTRCQHCGLWFQGEAFQFAPGEDLAFEEWDRRKRVRFRLWLALLAVGIGGLLTALLLLD
jgi:hypothetical protein